MSSPVTPACFSTVQSLIFGAHTNSAYFAHTGMWFPCQLVTFHHCPIFITAPWSLRLEDSVESATERENIVSLSNGTAGPELSPVASQRQAYCIPIHTGPGALWQPWPSLSLHCSSSPICCLWASGSEKVYQKWQVSDWLFTVSLCQEHCCNGQSYCCLPRQTLM